MCIQQSRPRPKNDLAWQVLFCLAILSFLCRALVPVGYMPDTASKRDGFFSITLCSPGGTPSTILMSLTGPDDSTTSDGHTDVQPCPYGLVLSQAALPSADMASLDSPASHAPLLLPQRNQTRPPLPALGPPLGSRAPPANLA
ncbi:MAG: DUF2946 family protein [Alcaligenes pakistanensis]